jgi:4-hydroxy-tetrahydrodipicolinate synthase
LCENYLALPEKSAILQDFLGVTSVMESRMYPVCAKYYLNLSGVTMRMSSRTRDESEFSMNFQMEFDELKRLTEKYLMWFGRD